MAQPIIQGGVFSTPDALGVSKHRTGHLAKGLHNQDTILGNVGEGQGGGVKKVVDVQADTSYPLGQYWANVDALSSLVNMDADEDDNEAQYDAHGVRLPDPVRPLRMDGVAAGAKVENIRVLFEREHKEAERDFCPMGLVSPEGTHFRIVFPPGEAGKKFITRLIDISFILRPATIRFRSRIEHQLVVSWILPTPVHVSPLALALARIREPCERFTDAISSACRLRVMRDAIMELDATLSEHKERAKRFYIILANHVASPFYRQVDALVARLNAFNPSLVTPSEARDVVTSIVREFASAVDHFALAYIHALEWNICDLLLIPYNLRRYLLTPAMLPTASSSLSPASFGALRTNLSNYVRDRNLVFCAHYDEETRRYTHIRPDAWNPMELDNPSLEDRLQILDVWRKGTKEAELYGAKCIYGLHNDWIDLYTLFQYMKMVTTDTRKPPKAKEEALPEDEEVNPTDPMDEGPDDFVDAMELYPENE